MSEDDTELRDLLVQTLEKNGTLAKLRAQLRASVFLAFEEQEKHKLDKNPLQNVKAQKFLSTDDGRLCCALVLDFLNCLSLQATESVFKPETGILECMSRKDLTSQLDIPLSTLQSDDDLLHEKPLILALMQKRDFTPNNNGQIVDKSTMGDTFFTTRLSEGLENVSLGDEFYPVGMATSDIFGPTPKTPTNDYIIGSSITTRPKPSTMDFEPVLTRTINNANNQTSSIIDFPSSLSLHNNETIKKSAEMSKIQSTGFLSDLPSLGGGNGDMKKRPTDSIDLKKLIGDSDESAGNSDNSSKSSRKALGGAKLFSSIKSDQKHEKPTNMAKNALSSGQKTNIAALDQDDEISEEIVEDLEVDDLLNSARSNDPISF